MPPTMATNTEDQQLFLSHETEASKSRKLEAIRLNLSRVPHGGGYDIECAALMDLRRELHKRYFALRSNRHVLADAYERVVAAGDANGDTKVDWVGGCPNLREMSRRLGEDDEGVALLGERADDVQRRTRRLIDGLRGW